jgi:hypothetical protein
VAYKGPLSVDFNADHRQNPGVGSNDLLVEKARHSHLDTTRPALDREYPRLGAWHVKRPFAFNLSGSAQIAQLAISDGLLPKPLRQAFRLSVLDSPGKSAR